MKKHVLVLDGYARQTLPMARGFRESGCEVTVVCFSRLDVGYRSRWPHHKILWPCHRDEYDVQEHLAIQLISSGEYDLVIPMTDYSAIYLAKNKIMLSKYAYISVNDWEVFQVAIDKFKTMQACDRFQIPSPKTLFSSCILEDVQKSDLRFPLVVKPKTACGSIGFSIIDDFNHLKRVIENYHWENGEIFIQEYIPQNGSQYGAEVYRDNNGKFIFTLIDEKPRWFPLDGGSPTINISIHNEKMKEMAEKLLEMLNWHGYANIDFVVDSRDGQPKILEINARISAAVKLDFCCGINVAKVILDDAFSDSGCYLTYSDGIKTSCILTELLWFLKSPNRFKQKPLFLNRSKTSDVVFSWRDPLPFFAFCLQSIKNYRKAMAQRKRK